MDSRPRSSGGNASNQEPSPTRTRLAAHPATFADATASASSLASVAQTSTSGSAASSASAIAPEPVPRSATHAAIGRSSGRTLPYSAEPDALRFLERDLDDPLGLRPRDQHAGIHHEVEPAERPRAEHVLERLTANTPLAHTAQPGLGAFGCGQLRDVEPLRGSRTGDFFDHESGFGVGIGDAAGGERARDLGAQRAPTTLSRPHDPPS